MTLFIQLDLCRWFARFVASSSFSGLRSVGWIRLNVSLDVARLRGLL